MAKKTIDKKKRIPWRKRDSWISFIPDTLNLVLYLFLLYASYELENKLIPIVFGSYALKYLVNLMFLTSQKLYINGKEKQVGYEEDLLWGATVNKIAELSIAAFIIISFAKFVVPVSYHIGPIDAWIGFAGSIIAGFITMMGVIFTIKHTTTSKRRYTALGASPNLQVTNIALTSHGHSHEKVNNIVTRTEFVFFFEIEMNNASAFPARDLHFESVVFRMYDSFLLGFEKNPQPSEDHDLTKKFNEEVLSGTLLKNGNAIQFSTLLSAQVSDESEFPQGTFVIEVVFSCFDVYHVYKHITKSTIEFLPYKSAKAKDSKTQAIKISSKIRNSSIVNDDFIL